MALEARPEKIFDQAHTDRMRFYASREWHLLRFAVIERAGGICERCHMRKVREVDHKTYERFGGRELLSDLQGLCGPCHDWKGGYAAGGVDPAPAWAAFFGPVMRQHGLLRETEPVAAAGLAKKLNHQQLALPGSAGERFLGEKGISLEVAQSFGLGFAKAASSETALAGRLVFPGNNPGGEVISLLGRALPRVGGEMGGAARWTGEGEGIAYLGAETLNYRCNAIVCRNTFDALALAAAGAENVVAVGASGWRWPWAIPLRRITLGFDPNRAGAGWERIGYEAEIMNMPLEVIAPAEGEDDYATQWAAGDQASVRAAVRKMAQL